MAVNFSDAWKSGNHIVDSAISLLPNLILAIIIFIIFLIIASGIKRFVRHAAERHQRRQSLGILFGQIAQTAIVIVGFLIAFSVVAPSFHASDLIKMLGIGSVAIGFAFQNILQNFLAGILLLLHEPFRIGDCITVTGLEGKVDDIQTRATLITANDGRRVVIPNAILFTNPVVVANPDMLKDHPQQTSRAPGTAA